MNANTSFQFYAYGESIHVTTDMENLESILTSMFPQIATPTVDAQSLSIQINRIRSSTPAITADRHTMICNAKGYCLMIDDRIVVSIQRNTPHAAVSIDPHWLDSSPEMTRALLLEAPVLVLLAWFRFPLVHAAGIAINDKGYILTGASGSGKSSLAYACVKAGCKFIAEDYLFVAERNGSREIRGVPASLKLCRDAIPFFPELAGQSAVKQLNGEYKIETIDTFPDNQRLSCAALTDIVMLTNDTHADTTVTDRDRITGEQVLPHIIDNLMFDPEGVYRRHRSIYHRFTRNGALWLGKCATPTDRSSLLQKLIERHS